MPRLIATERTYILSEYQIIINAVIVDPFLRSLPLHDHSFTYRNREYLVKVHSEVECDIFFKDIIEIYGIPSRIKAHA